MITNQLTYSPLELVCLDEAMEHSRITDLEDEDMIRMALDSAHDIVQQWVNRKLVPTTMVGIQEDYLNEVILPYPPIKSITSVHAEDVNGNEIELTTDQYKFNDVYGSVKLPTSLSSMSNFKIVYDCGYGDGIECPLALKHAIRMTFATLYEMREDAIIGAQINDVPLTAKNLVKIYRVRSSR